MTTMAAPIIIIGTGIAGYSVARELRKLDADCALHLLTADDGSNYSKPMLSNALAKSKTADALVQSTADAMAASLNVSIDVFSSVTAIDADNHQIALDDGRQLHYSKLVLAVGAQPQVPPLAGEAREQLFQVNSLQDYRLFRQHLDRAEHISIIGSGLIGCEFANDFLAAGKQVALIGKAAQPLEQLIPTAMAEQLTICLAQQGLDWYLQDSAAALDRDGNKLRLQLNSQQLSTDLVLSATGLRANLRLAQQAGLATGKGIITDDYLQCSKPDIYALGDCAEVRGHNLMFIMPVMHCSRALAQTLANQPTAVHYPAMPVVIKTPAYPMVVAASQDKHAIVETQIAVADSGFGVRQLHYDTDGQLLGFAISGDFVKQRQSLAQSLPAWL